MKLQAEIDGKTHDVEIRRDTEKLFARVDDREYELEVSEPENGVFLLRSEGQMYEAFVSEADGQNEPTTVSIRNSEFEVTIFDPKRLRASGSDHAHGDGLVEIKTAMPGKVVRILSTVGDHIKKGDGVIVVEAMKMQNEMRSPRDGTVKEICVDEGATVNAGEVLIVIE